MNINCPSSDYELVLRKWKNACPVFLTTSNTVIGRPDIGSFFTVPTDPFMQMITNPYPKIEVNRALALTSSSTSGTILLSDGISADETLNVGVIRIDINSSQLQTPVFAATFEITGYATQNSTQVAEQFKLKFTVESVTAAGCINSMFVNLGRKNTSIDATIPVDAVVQKDSAGAVTYDLSVVFTNVPKESAVIVRNVFPGSDDWCAYTNALFANNLYLVK